VKHHHRHATHEGSAGGHTPPRLGRSALRMQPKLGHQQTHMFEKPSHLRAGQGWPVDPMLRSPFRRRDIANEHGLACPCGCSRAPRPCVQPVPSGLFPVGCPSRSAVVPVGGLAMASRHFCRTVPNRPGLCAGSRWHGFDDAARSSLSGPHAFQLPSLSEAVEMASAASFSVAKVPSEFSSTSKASKPACPRLTMWPRHVRPS
jgi:hypothetical protein